MIRNIRNITISVASLLILSTIMSNTDGFENGFSSSWNPGAEGNWFITDSNPYVGEYSVTSDIISSTDQIHILSLDLPEISSNGNAVFHPRISGLAKLEVLVDGSSIAEFSSNDPSYSDWGKVVIPILAGSNILEFRASLDTTQQCPAGQIPDCSGDGDCCSEGWIGDGFTDCEDQQYGCDLTCYDNDGGDCDGIGTSFVQIDEIFYPPLVVNAGDDIDISEAHDGVNGAYVSLSASNGTDNNSDFAQLAYRWYIAPSTEPFAIGLNPDVTLLPRSYASPPPQAHEIVLAVEFEGNYVEDIINVYITEPNQAPIGNLTQSGDNFDIYNTNGIPGNFTVINLLQYVNYASLVDPDGDSYDWDWVHNSSNGAQVDTILASPLVQLKTGTHIFDFRLRDPYYDDFEFSDSYNTYQIVFDLEEQNEPPSITLGDDLVSFENTEITISASVDDLNNDTTNETETTEDDVQINWSCVNLSSNESVPIVDPSVISPTLTTISIDNNIEQPQTISCTIDVKDPFYDIDPVLYANAFVSDTITIDVYNFNQVPIITPVVPYVSIHEGEQTCFEFIDDTIFCNTPDNTFIIPPADTSVTQTTVATIQDADGDSVFNLNIIDSDDYLAIDGNCINTPDLPVENDILPLDIFLQATDLIESPIDGEEINNTSEQFSFRVNITAVNDPPEISFSGSDTIEPSEDVNYEIFSLAVSDEDSDDLEVYMKVVNGTLTLSSTNGLAFNYNEAIGDGTDDQELKFTGNKSLINDALSGMVYLSNSDYHGPDTLIMSIEDHNEYSPHITDSVFPINVQEVNDPPTFSILESSIDQLEDSGSIQIDNFITDIFPGASDEWDHLEGIDPSFFTVTIGNSDLFSEGGLPSLILDGTSAHLAFEAADNLHGISLITVSLTDLGPSDGLNENTSMVLEKSLEILPVNDQPVFSFPDSIELNEDSFENQLYQPGLADIPDNEQDEVYQFSLFPSVDDIDFVDISINQESGEIVINPVENAYGSLDDIVISVTDNLGTDNGGIDTYSSTFNLSVGLLNDPPVNTNAPTIFTTTAFQVRKLLSIETDPDDWDDSADSDFNNSYFFSPSFEYQWESASDSLGADLTIVICQDGSSNTENCTLTANDAHRYVRAKVTATDNGDGSPESMSSSAYSEFYYIENSNPVAFNERYFVFEDNTLVSSNVDGSDLNDGLLENDRDFDDDVLSASIADPPNPSFGSVEIFSDGNFIFTPAYNHNSGTCNADSDGVYTCDNPVVFTYELSDGYGGTATGTVTIDIVPVNDPPNFEISGDVSFDEDYSSGSIIVAEPVIIDVPWDEAGQDVIYTVSPTELPFADAFDIHPFTGLLTMTLTEDAYGQSDITITADDSEPDNNQVSTTFELTVNPVNDPPAFSENSDTDPIIIEEDSGLYIKENWAYDITEGPATLDNESSQTLSFVYETEYSELFAVEPSLDVDTGDLQFMIQDNYFGEISVAMALQDDDLENPQISEYHNIVFTITAVNDPPVNTSEPQMFNVSEQLFSESTQLDQVLEIYKGDWNDSLDVSFADEDEDIDYSFSWQISNQQIPSGGSCAFLDDYSPIDADEVGENNCGPGPEIENGHLCTVPIYDGFFGKCIRGVVTATTDGIIHEDGSDNDISTAIAYTSGILISTAAPVANNDVILVPVYEDVDYIEEESPTNQFGILSNDTDEDNDLSQLVAKVAQLPENGRLYSRIDSEGLWGEDNLDELYEGATFDGFFLYRPDENYNGPDSFTYLANDQMIDSEEIALVTLEVIPVNDPPTCDIPDNISSEFEEDDPNAILSNIYIDDVDGKDFDLDVTIEGFNSSFELARVDGLTVLDGENRSKYFKFRAPQDSINVSINSITLLPENNYSGDDSLLITIEDNRNNGEYIVNSDAGLCSQDGCIVQSAVVFEYIAVNDPPAFTFDAIDVLQEDLFSVQDIEVVKLEVPPDEQDTVRYSLYPNPDDIDFVDISIDPDNGNIRILSIPNQNTGGEPVTFTITANDFSEVNNIYEDYFNIIIEPRNDPPFAEISPDIVNGIYSVGDLLTAIPGSWSDATDTDISGSSDIDLSIQWQRRFSPFDDNTEFIDIPGENSEQYLLDVEDAHAQIRIEVVAEDDGVGNPGTQYSIAWSDPIVVENSDPVGYSDYYVINEDENLVVEVDDGLLDNDFDIDNDVLSAELCGNCGDPFGIIDSIDVDSTGSFIYYKITNLNSDYLNGDDFSFEYYANDGKGGETPPVEAFINILPVNDAPKFEFFSSLFINEEGQDIFALDEDSFDQEIIEINQIDTPEDELSQVVTYAMYPESVEFIDIEFDQSTGRIELSRKAEAYGEEEIMITATDNGGIDRDGENEFSKSFILKVLAVNDPPSFVISDDNKNIYIDEDAGTKVIENFAENIQKGALYEDHQTLYFNVSSSDDSCFSTPPTISELNGELSFNTSLNCNGTLNLTVSLSDDGENIPETTEDQFFSIHVNPVNDPPYFEMDSEHVTEEDSPLIDTVWASNIRPIMPDVGGADELVQTVSFTVDVVDNDRYLFDVLPSIDSQSGKISYKPVSNANGRATVIVTLTDAMEDDPDFSAESYSKSLDIYVRQVNDAPQAFNNFADLNNYQTPVQEQDSVTVFYFDNNQAPVFRYPYHEDFTPDPQEYVPLDFIWERNDNLDIDTDESINKDTTLTTYYRIEMFDGSGKTYILADSLSHNDYQDSLGLYMRYPVDLTSEFPVYSSEIYSGVSDSLAVLDINNTAQYDWRVVSQNYWLRDSSESLASGDPHSISTSRDTTETKFFEEGFYIDLTRPSADYFISSNYLFPDYFDMYYFPDEETIEDDARVQIESVVDGDLQNIFPFKVPDADQEIYQLSGSYPDNGTVSFSFQVRDRAMNLGRTKDTLSVGMLYPENQAIVYSPDNMFSIQFESGSIDSQTGVFMSSQAPISNGKVVSKSNIIETGYYVDILPYSTPITKDAILRFDISDIDSEQYNPWNYQIYRYQDEELNPVETFFKDDYIYGNISELGTFSVFIDPSIEMPIPENFLVNAPFPNPFNSRVSIPIEIPIEGDLALSVVDINGRLVQSISDGPVQPGYYDIFWDGLDQKGNSCASGVYMLRILYDNNQSLKKFTLIK